MKRTSGVKIIRGNMVTELRKLAKGKPTKLPAQFIAEFALRNLDEGVILSSRKRNGSVDFLDKMFRLEDPRPETGRG